MNPRTVSATAALFCTVVVFVVALFGYSRYRKAQAENAVFRQTVLQEQHDENTPLKARMPTQLPPRATSVLAGDTPLPGASPEPLRP